VLQPTGAAVTAAVTFVGPILYTTSLATSPASTTHTQAAYPTPSSASCGSWTLSENVCCPSYCSNDNRSESCSTSGTCDCVTVPAAMCKSGTMYPEVHLVTNDEDWHYSVRPLSIFYRSDPKYPSKLTEIDCEKIRDQHISALHQAEPVALVFTASAHKEV